MMMLVPQAADVVGEVFQARLRLGLQLETCPSPFTPKSATRSGVKK